MYQKIISSIVCFCFIFSNFQYVHARDFSVNQLPIPGKMVEVSSAFSPVSLRGLIVNPKKPLEFEFLVDTGGSHPVQSEGSKRDSSAPKSMAHQNDDIKDKALKDESNRLIKYFLAGLTIPEGDLWVNLSPYEKDRITTSSLGETELGRDLLAQDYILKQLTASLIYPEKDLGREFWNKVYKEAQVKYGTTNIPVNTFNKVWILPDEAQIFESQKGAYVTKATLKVMLAEDYEASAKSRQNKNFGGLEEDYVAMQKHSVILSAAKDLKRDSSSLKSVPQNDTSIIESQIVRDIVLPAITKEVNEGANFAPLRQIYHSLILAKWYKETVANGLLDAVYINKGKIKGINLNDPSIKQQIYNRYLQAYKKGVFNYIKESSINAQDSGQHPRKYFSGGLVWTMTVQRDGAMTGVVPEGQLVAFQVKLDSAMSADAAYSDRKAKLERLTGLIKEIIDSYNQGLNVYLDSLRDVNLIGIKHLIPNSLYIIRNLVDIHQRHPEAVSMKIDIIRREINGLKEILTRFADYQSKDEVLSWAQTILKQIPTVPRSGSPQAGLLNVWFTAKFVNDGHFTEEFAQHVFNLKQVFDKNSNEILTLTNEISLSDLAMAGQVMNGIDSFDKFMDLIKQAKEYDELEKKLESVYSDKAALERWLKLLKEVYEENELYFYSLLNQVAKLGNIQPLEVTKIQRKLFKDPKVESYLIRKGLLVKDGSFRGEISLELLVILQAAIRANLRNIDFRYSKEFLLKDEISNDFKIKVLLKKVYIVLKDLPPAQKRFLTLNDLMAAVERILANDFLLEEESLLKSIVAKVSSHTKTVILGDRTYYELDNSSIRFSEIEIKKLVDSMVRELNLYDTQSIALAVYDRWGKEAYDEPTETMDQVVSLIKRKLILKLASGIEEFKTGLFFFNVEKKAKEVAKLLEIKNKILRLKGIDSAMSAFQPSNSQRLSEAAQRIIGFFSHKEEIKRNEIIGFIQSNDIPLEALKEVLETSEQEFYRARIAVCKIIQQILINPSFRTHSLVAQIRTNDFWNFLLSHAYESWGVDGFFKGKERNANVRAAILKTLAEVDINKSLSYLSTSLDYRLEPSPLVRQVAINVINNKLERIKKSNTTGFVIAAIKKAIKEESKVNLIVHHRVLGLLEDHLLSIRQKNDGSRGAGDSAQLAKKPVTLVKAPGGIDLNRIAIKRTGYVIKMEFDPNELNQLLQDGFIGFYPVIMNITPISSPLTLLGQALPKEKEAQVRI